MFRFAGSGFGLQRQASDNQPTTERALSIALPRLFMNLSAEPIAICRSTSETKQKQLDMLLLSSANINNVHSLHFAMFRRAPDSQSCLELSSGIVAGPAVLESIK